MPEDPGPRIADPEKYLPDREQHAREVELARDRVDDVDLAGVESGCKRRRRHFELEERGVTVGRVHGRAFHDWCFEHLDLASVEREAGAELRSGAVGLT